MLLSILAPNEAQNILEGTLLDRCRIRRRENGNKSGLTGSLRVNFYLNF